MSDFNKKFKLPYRFSNNIQKSNFTKFRPTGTKLFHVEWRTKGQTDMKKLIVVSRNFENTLTNGGQGKRM